MKKVLVVLAVLIGGVLIFAALQPSHMLVSRELTINAPAEAIFPHINNSKKANDWMPWKESDPGVQTVYSGPEEGVGSTSSWDSKGKMGTGQAVVIESIPNQTVKTQLTYTKPMEMSQVAEISLTPAPGGTVVKWSVTGENKFMGKIMCLFMNMDKVVGTEFEKGLENLKKTVETPQ